MNSYYTSVENKIYRGGIMENNERAIKLEARINELHNEYLKLDKDDFIGKFKVKLEIQRCEQELYKIKGIENERSYENER